MLGSAAQKNFCWGLEILHVRAKRSPGSLIRCFYQLPPPAGWSMEPRAVSESASAGEEVALEPSAWTEAAVSAGRRFRSEALVRSSRRRRLHCPWRAGASFTSGEVTVHRDGTPECTMTWSGRASIGSLMHGAQLTCSPSGSGGDWIAWRVAAVEIHLESTGGCRPFFGATLRQTAIHIMQCALRCVRRGRFARSFNRARARPRHG